MMSYGNTGTSKYQYTRLPAKCIRVLQISSPPSQVRFEIVLKVISLDGVDEDHPSDSYDCLSYTWGDPRDDRLPLLYVPPASKGISRRLTGNTNKRILVQGKFVEVSANCFHALERLNGDSQRQSWIWIDAICIDQSSALEKAQQIPLMGEIYKHAESVIIWLGQEDGGTRDAHNLLQRLSSIDPSSKVLKSRSYNIDSAQACEQLEEASDDMGMNDISIDDWHHLAHFLQRAWFSRVWVVQEVFFSKRAPRVLIGDHELKWKDIMQSMNILKETHLDTVLKAYMFDLGIDQKAYNIAAATSEALENRLANAHIFGIMYDRKVENKQFRLDQLLYYTRFFNAKQPEDHIFGIQGLWISSGANEESTARIISLFGSPLEKIYVEAMRVAILESGRLDILGLRGNISENLPSWVVDFRETPGLYPLTRNLEFGDHPRRWQAGRGIIPAPMQEFDVSDPKKLLVGGFEFDTIVGDEAPSFPEVDTRFRISKLLQFLARARQDAYGITNAYSAFLRTVIKDTYTGESTDAEISDGFSAFLAVRILEHERMLHDVAQTNITETSHQLASLLKETEDIVNGLSHKYPLFPSWATLKETKHVIGMNGAPGRTELERHAMKFSECFRIAYFGRKLFQTEKGYFGITSELVEKGDKIWISSNSDTPLVLRPQTTNGNYTLVGEAYIHGIMNGEAVSDDRCGSICALK
ncbi:hypothetical protein G7054_g1547 [Neopestalotiopsis clavispora]|nr:hypothetical protein G7054_g1547 [Neopestalotiopsis clavispora]